MKLIADSGSTKTAWCLLHEHHAKLITTQGINPFQLDEADMAAVIQKELLPQLEMYGQSIQLDDIVERIGEIFFYGAGCTSEKAPLHAYYLFILSLLS